jgi:hypothetical protein
MGPFCSGHPTPAHTASFRASLRARSRHPLGVTHVRSCTVREPLQRLISCATTLLVPPASRPVLVRHPSCSCSGHESSLRAAPPARVPRLPNRSHATHCCAHARAACSCARPRSPGPTPCLQPPERPFSREPHTSALDARAHLALVLHASLLGPGRLAPSCLALVQLPRRTRCLRAYSRRPCHAPPRALGHAAPGACSASRAPWARPPARRATACPRRATAWAAAPCACRSHSSHAPAPAPHAPAPTARAPVRSPGRSRVEPLARACAPRPAPAAPRLGLPAAHLHAPHLQSARAPPWGRARPEPSPHAALPGWRREGERERKTR